MEVGRGDCRQVVRAELVGPLWVGRLWVEGWTEPVGYPWSVSLGPGLDLGVST